MYRFLLLIVAFFLLQSCGGDQPPDKSAIAENTAGEVAYSDSVVIEMTGQDSVSVFELLKSEHEVEYTSSLMGVFIKAIDSLESGSSVFWVYSVNDTMVDVAADKRLTRTGDRVIWHFRKAR